MIRPLNSNSLTFCVLMLLAERREHLENIV